MKKAIAVLAIAAGLAVPAVAEAHTLPGYVARNAAEDVALDWYLNSPAESYWVDWCRRVNAHRTRCDANISWTTYGATSCPSYSDYCHATDTDHVCWKTVTAWTNARIGRQAYYRVGGEICRTQSHTDYF